MIFSSSFPELLYISSKALYAMVYQSIFPTISIKCTCQEITQRILCYYCDCDRIDIILNISLAVTASQQKGLHHAIDRIKNYEPIQYITQEAYFFDWKFRVTPAVLIPRRETEEMVSYILKQHCEEGLAILDIGTGSGCIAIALEKLLLNAQVDALDMDEEALKIAMYNAQKLDAEVHFMQGNIFQNTLPKKKWHIIVSNPPYVPLSEKANMERNVLDYEPHHALFVPDDYPLKFYERITALATQHLYPKGRLYFEINEAFGEDIVNLLHIFGFEETSIMKDLQQKNRWVMGMLS